MALQFRTRLFNYSLSSLLAALVYSLLFHVPIAVHVHRIKMWHYLPRSVDAALEILVASFGVFCLLLCSSFNKWVRLTLLIPLYLCGAAGLYFVINYGWNFESCSALSSFVDTGTLIEGMLRSQSFVLVLTLIAIGIVTNLESGVALLTAYDWHAKVMLRVVVICFLSAAVISVSVPESYIYHSVACRYPPFSFVKMMWQQYKSQSHVKRLQPSSFLYLAKGDEPINVVLILGKSMRSDDIGINNAGSPYDDTPNISKLPNVISFKQSLAVDTKSSIPIILSRHTPGAPQRSDNLNIIRVFKSMGFRTMWLGQSLSFLPNAMAYNTIPEEADEVLTNLNQAEGNDMVYEEDYLSGFRTFLSSNGKQNKLVVFNMLGSGWDFYKRYPKNFGHFHPECRQSQAMNCSMEELQNSYHNRVLYTDYIIGEVVKSLKDKKALLLFISTDVPEGLKSSHSEKSPLPTVGMFAWGSDKFIAGYPSNYGRLRQVTDAMIFPGHVFHTLLGCLDVRSAEIERGLNLCTSRVKFTIHSP